VTAARDNPLELLCEIVAGGQEALAAGGFGGLASPAVATLLRGNLLSPSSVVDAVLCDACGEPHTALRTFDAGRKAHGWYCPHVGFVAATDEDIAAFVFTMDRLAASIDAAFREAFGPSRERSRSIGGVAAWIVGDYVVEGRRLLVTLTRASVLQTDIVEALLRLPRRDATLLLVPSDEPQALTLPASFVPVSLPSVMSISVDGILSVDGKFLRRHLDRVAFAAGPARGGRPGRMSQVWHVLDEIYGRPDRVPEGVSLASSVADRWAEFFPNEKCPVDSVLRKHAASWRRQ
jgi:hypothetical protein